MNRRTYTVTETAEILGISRSSAYEAVRRGDIPSIAVGHRIVIARSVLDRLIDGDADDQPKIAAATGSAASRPSAGVTWEYRSNVMPTLAWPSRSDTTFGCTPAFNASVAYMWRRSCKRIRCEHARSPIKPNSRVMRSRWCAPPNSSANTRSNVASHP